MVRNGMLFSGARKMRREGLFLELQEGFFVQLRGRL